MLVLADMNVEHREYMKFRSTVFVYNDIKPVEDMIPVRQLTIKLIYHELFKTKFEESRAEAFWLILWKFECIPAWLDVWIFKFKGIKHSLLINFHFKFMYNILAIPNNLFKVNATEQCYNCIQTGDCMHMPFFLTKSLRFRMKLKGIFRNIVCLILISNHVLLLIF